MSEKNEFSSPARLTLTRQQNVRVLILAGGLGTRMRALFPDCPKPLIPIRGKPFLEWQLGLLIRQGFSDFVLCVGYQAAQIIQHLGNGNRWGITIEYSMETTPLGTAGALRNANRFFQQTALVLNGDTFLATNYRALLERHREHETIGSLGLVTVDHTHPYGQVMLGDGDRVKEFREKDHSQCETGLINSGVYVLEPRVLGYIPSGRAVSLEHEIFPTLAAEGNLCGYQVTGAFVDMGTPEGYETLVTLLSHGPPAN